MLAMASIPFHIIRGQQPLHTLSVGQIMQDPKWIGSSPTNVFWSPDSKRIFFQWNPVTAASDSLYYYSLLDKTIRKADDSLRESALAGWGGTYSPDRKMLVYSQQGNIFLLHVATGQTLQITGSSMPASSPLFLHDLQKIAYVQGGNLYLWNGTAGTTRQLTDFEQRGPEAAPSKDTQSSFLQKDAFENSSVLREREVRRQRADSTRILEARKRKPRILYTDGRDPDQLIISPDARFISYRLFKNPTDVKHTIVPAYVTASGYTEEIHGREKVGAPQGTATTYIFDRVHDTIYPVVTSQIPGIRDLPDYLKDYPGEDSLMRKAPPLRAVMVMGPFWNEGGTHAFVVVRSQDNKDRWIMLLDPLNGSLSLLDRQRDEAWVDGPGIGWDFGEGNVGWVNDSTCWFQSEVTGYSHLYLENIRKAEKQDLTPGKYEVLQAQLSLNHRFFYLTTNEVHPGEMQGYTLEIRSGKLERMTSMGGGNELTPSPDNRWLALRYSRSNQPWELYLQASEPGVRSTKITDKAESLLFHSYPWRTPEIITFRDHDGSQVYSRLFRPIRQAATRPGVIFIHGAGYLQDAHKYWSDDYFREYMFENLLCDEGYVVMDIDYRGSAGYGRDWRTAIYRHMGGKDLDDILDGAGYMMDSLNVDKSRIGIWGGSYGGFLTLMALFTHPGVFACGAGLRSVTDWAHYNPEYTSNILNEPAEDSLAYIRSSPIYFAAGLKDHLLMCHGMQDTNVNFQDIVRLTEKLIELGKTHWELANYPLENHSFTDASSWTDEYRRIHALFSENLLGHP
jgi:dipeptidyl aminopeptidase/acylaminoacyl peptidase